jgi:7-cyano-7-deazaguanine synthase in queuosine biosynthesis
MWNRVIGLSDKIKPIDFSHSLPLHIALRGQAKHIHWPDICKDLVEVASAIYLADRKVSRPRGSFVSRSIELKLPVRQTNSWNRVEPLLREVLEILSGDLYFFKFHQIEGGGACFPANASHREKIEKNRVTLFSGGLDSGSAAAIFAKKDIQSVYVTHYVNRILKIQNLLEDIHNTYSKQPGTLLHAQFHIRPVGEIVRQLNERTRRSRSFLFVSLAVAVAVAIGAQEVCVCENGPLAVNIALSPTMVPTRHAHSRFLKAMEHLALKLFSISLKIFNPFESKTKGEMCRVFVTNPGLALRTISCWNQQWSGKGKSYGKGHCGYCVPCLVRRASLKTGGIKIPQDHFDIDIQKLKSKPHLSPEESNRLSPYRALLNFSKKINACKNPQEFLNYFPEIIETESTSHPMGIDEWYKNLFGTMKRFAYEIDTIL